MPRPRLVGDETLWRTVSCGHGERLPVSGALAADPARERSGCCCRAGQFVLDNQQGRAGSLLITTVRGTRLLRRGLSQLWAVGVRTVVCCRTPSFRSALAAPEFENEYQARCIRTMRGDDLVLHCRLAGA